MAVFVEKPNKGPAACGQFTLLAEQLLTMETRVCRPVPINQIVHRLCHFTSKHFCINLLDLRRKEIKGLQD